jgi:hypothetical protein
MNILKKGNSNTKEFNLHIFNASNSGLWGGVLESLQRGTDKCIRPGAKESG